LLDPPLPAPPAPLDAPADPVVATAGDASWFDEPHATSAAVSGPMSQGVHPLIAAIVATTSRGCRARLPVGEDELSIEPATSPRARRETKVCALPTGGPRKGTADDTMDPSFVRRERPRGMLVGSF
jgi:hypothetical protein